MNTSPKISVVLPCWNAHKFLSRALNSLCAQTFRDFEIIVVDDGSTNPQTISYFDTMPGNIRLVRQENRGLSAARNRGFSEAFSPYVLPLDCDDWIAPEFLSDAYQRICATPEASFVFPDMIALEGEMAGILEKKHNLFEQLFFNQLPYCMLISRSSWLAVGGYDTKMRQGYEDWEFNIRLSLNGYRGIPLGKSHFHYWVNSSGMLGSISRQHHIKLWRYIRSKHCNAYTIIGLARCWKRWRHKKSVRPLFLYFLWEFVFRILPNRMMIKLFQMLRPWSHSVRIDRKQIRT